MAEVITVTEQGASAALYANRDCSIAATSTDWASETLALEQSTDRTNWITTRDQAGDPVEFTANDVWRIPGGFYYRVDKSGATAVVVLQLVKARGNGN